MKNSITLTQCTSLKPIWLYFMSAAYILAGVNHFFNPDMYLRIIPEAVPLPAVINYVTGAAEMVLGFLLLIKHTRNLAAWGIIVLLVAVFPANIKMAHDYTTHQHALTWAAWLRLPLQGLLILWAYVYTDVYKRRRSA